jgi:hypothetical protein
MGNILKTTVILSAIVGLAAGVLFLINLLLLKFLVVFALFIITGAGIIIYLKKNALVGFLTVQNGALVGAVSGFISLIAAATVFVPINSIIELFTSHYKHTPSFTDFSYTLIMSIIMIFFVALVISAPFNAISAMLATYIYEKIEDKPFEFHTNFEIEQDD